MRVTVYPIGLKELGGFPMEPNVSLDVGTEVKIDKTVKVNPSDFGQYNLDTWHFVTVLKGPHKDKQGYLPESALSASQLKYGPLFPGTISNLYGMIGEFSSADPKKVPHAYCPECKEAAALHVMPNTEGTYQDALKLYTLVVIEANAKKDTTGTVLSSKDRNGLFVKFQDGKLLSKEVMIGVLHTKSKKKIYASHSNQQDSESFRKLAKHLGFIYAGPVKGPVLTRRGEPAVHGGVDKKKGAQVDMQKFDYQCAAPRLIQAALRDKEYPVAMTEIFIAKEEDRRAVPSCGRCQLTVPYMLCPV